MPLFFIKLVIFIIKYAVTLRKRKRSHIKRYIGWIERKGMYNRVSYTEDEVTQIGSKKCCANHMLIPGWFLISFFFGIFIALAGLRLDGRVKTSWFVIFLPVWIISLPLFVLAVFKGLTIGEKGQRSKCEDLFWALLIPSRCEFNSSISAFIFDFNLAVCGRRSALQLVAPLYSLLFRVSCTLCFHAIC